MHISSYLTANGVPTANSHDVGDRISWTLREIRQARAEDDCELTADGVLNPKAPFALPGRR